MDTSTQSNEFIDALFFDASLALEEFQLPEKKTAAHNSKPETPSERETLDQKMPELSRLLADAGIENAKTRLAVKNGAFRLCCTPAEHAADRSILFDLSKVYSLVAAGYVAVEVEPDGQHYCIDILAADLLPELTDPDSFLADPAK